jgi:hypothetical protein
VRLTAVKKKTSRQLARRNAKIIRDLKSAFKGRLEKDIVRRLAQPLVILTLPIIVSRKLWLEVLNGIQSRAWDGTGHYAAAQIYSSSVFPDTFGWTDAYFGGMPFPNFYPPLFYWIVSLLESTRLVSFSTAFKLVLIIPVLLMPAVLWLLGYAVSNKSRLLATAVALAAIPLLCDSRFSFILPAGLDYFSTFQIGLYTQPLGFVLMIAWYVVYSRVDLRRWRFALASVLLALTVLANFFNAVTAAIFVAATVIAGAVRYRRASDGDGRREERGSLISHLLSPLISFGLSLFWLLPMINSYEYFVTRPFVVETGQLVTPSLWLWYALAALGGFFWVRRYPTRLAWPYLAACVVLGAIVLFAATIAPPWFPLQSPRFLATLNFLLTVPVGYALTAAFRAFAKLLGEVRSTDQPLTLRRVRYTAGTALVILSILALSSPGTRWAYAFYPRGGKGDIDGVLAFARDHRDGRYLVEVINPTINPAYTEASFDARAVNSYLGAQGNETLNTVFHEASPSVLFTLPFINAFSNYPDSFGISSVLADDLDFHNQPLSEHIRRARVLGVKYLVIRTPMMKDRIGKEPDVAAKHDFGWWSVFELKGEPAPYVQELPYRPALVVSDFTLKSRRQNELSFVRLAEEQFADGWFDVRLVRSPERRLDRLRDLKKFGALIVDTFEYDDEDAAFGLLRDFGQDRSLVLISSEDRLFQRLRAARGDFPKMEIIERPVEDPGMVLEAVRPLHHYEPSAIRHLWKAIRGALDTNKVTAGVAEIASERSQGNIKLRPNQTAQTNEVPVLINTTFHPNWQRDDGEPVYATTPFNMLTFVSGPASLSYGRNGQDRAGAWASAGTLILLALFIGWPRLCKLWSSEKRSPTQSG